MNNIIPIFSSDASLGGAILTVEPAAEIKDNAPVSIFSIAKEHNLSEIYLVDKSFCNFITAYKNAEKLKKQLVFGIRFKVVSNAKDQSEESLKTESNICVFMRNSNGYKDLVKLYSASHANKETFYYTGRLDWRTLTELFTDNLLLTIPFYNSFIHKNLLNHNHLAVPQLGNIKPIFFIEEHGLPFDGIIRKVVQDQVDNFTEKDAISNMAANQPYPEKGGGFCGPMMCGAKNKGELKLDGSPKYVCPYRHPFDYFVLLDKETREIKDSAFTLEELEVSDSVVVEKRTFLGCPAFSNKNDIL